MATKKIDTTAELKAEMRKNGVRLPHGYTVVKRKPRKAVKKKTAVKKTTVAKKRTTPVKKKTTVKSGKMTPAQKKFAFNSKRAALMVKQGHAKNLKDAWKQIKTTL